MWLCALPMTRKHKSATHSERRILILPAMLSLLKHNKSTYAGDAMGLLYRVIVPFMLVPGLGAQTPPAVAPADSLARAEAALEHERPNEALAILQPMAGAQPPIKGVQHELGVVYYRTGKLVEAQQAFEKAIAQDASDKESVQMEGLVLYRLGHPAAAIPYLERVRQWMPGANADATYVLGLCYLNARRYDDARAAFAAQFGEPSDSAGAYLLMGTMLRHVNLPELAAVQAQKALELSPICLLRISCWVKSHFSNRTSTRPLFNLRRSAASIRTTPLCTIVWATPISMWTNWKKHSRHS